MPGRTDVVALLLAGGATVDPLTAGAQHAVVLCNRRQRRTVDGDWPGTIRALLAAGASTKGVWVDDKPPSEEIAALLYTYGITNEDEPDEPQETADPELAERLRTALETADLELFGGCCIPKRVGRAAPTGVRCWTGIAPCTLRACAPRSTRS